MNRNMNRNMNRDVARGRDLNRNLSRDIARGAAPSNRAAAREALRSAPVHARADARNANAFALRAFSGRDALAATGRVFRDPALFSRHRFDPAFFARVRFAGAFWPGPFFWPYAYYDEAFWLWPSAYDEAFWTYGYDDMLLGIYRPYAFSDYDDFVDAIGPVRRARGQAQAPAPRSFAELCGQAAPGLTDWPVDQIAAAIEPTQQQRALLDELVQASDKAAETLRAACPRGVAVTPIARSTPCSNSLAPCSRRFASSVRGLKGSMRRCRMIRRSGSMRLLRNPRPIVVRAARLRRKPTAWRARARVARQGLRSGRSNASRTPCGRASGSAPPSASFAPRARKPAGWLRRLVRANCH